MDLLLYLSQHLILSLLTIDLYLDTLMNNLFTAPSKQQEE